MASVQGVQKVAEEPGGAEPFILPQIRTGPENTNFLFPQTCKPATPGYASLVFPFPVGLRIHEILSSF